MVILATIVLWVWVPVVMAIFSSTRPRNAVLFSFVTAWLFLPPI